LFPDVFKRHAKEHLGRWQTTKNERKDEMEHQKDQERTTEHFPLQKVKRD
jgi:cytochrome oxidase assembly protein ShyY1